LNATESLVTVFVLADSHPFRLPISAIPASIVRSNVPSSWNTSILRFSLPASRP